MADETAIKPKEEDKNKNKNNIAEKRFTVYPLPAKLGRCH